MRTIIQFECRDCQAIFDAEVGNVSVDATVMRPVFEKRIDCPHCGTRTIDQLYLTELGQSQLTEATLDLLP